MSKSKGVSYKPYKNEHDEAKVILFDEENIKVERRPKHCGFKMSWKSMVPLCSGIVTFLILLVFVCFFAIHNSSKKCLFKNFVVSDRTNKEESCSPLQSIKRIEIMMSQDSNHSCSDTFTCNVLLSQTDTVKYHSNNDLRYNFLVSSDFKLIFVFGYDCSTVSNVHNEIRLTTTYIKNSQANVTSGPILHTDALKIMEIVYKGLKCNAHQSNFTMTSLCVDGCNLSGCGNIFDEEIIRLRMLRNDEHYTFQSLNNSENSSTVQDNLKWAVCEDPSEIVTHTQNVVKSRSSPCSLLGNYEPVDHISVDVVKVQYPVHCLENSTCSTNLLSFIGEDINKDLKYNFIFGSHGALYVGGGFRCRTVNRHNNSLNIQVIRPSQTSIAGEFHEMRRIAEIIEHGIFCGKIWKNYSISEYCSFGNCYPQYEYMSGKIVSILSTGYGQNKHNENEMDNNGQVYPYDAKWKSSCHHEEHSSYSLQTEHIDITTNKMLSPEDSVNTTTVQPNVRELEETTTEFRYVDGDYIDYEDYDLEYMTRKI